MFRAIAPMGTIAKGSIMLVANGSSKAAALATALVVSIVVALALVPTAAFAQACPASNSEDVTALYTEDFGTGTGRTSHPAVLNHGFQASGQIQDDWYAIGTAGDMSGNWMRSNGLVDADGSTNGRYAGINMRGRNQGGWQGEFFRIDDINMVAGDLLRFSVAVNGTCVGCPDVPNFTIFLYNSVDNSVIASYNSGAVGVTNSGDWVVVEDTISFPGGVPNVDLVLFNSQPSGASGNDVGIDNIFLQSVTCVQPDADFSVTKTNTPGVNGNVDQSNDSLASGSTTTYTVIVTNNGPDSAAGAVVTDTVSTGISCAATNTVTITGNGAPSGSFTVGDLTGPGITLGTLANGDSVTLTYSCEVN